MIDVDGIIVDHNYGLQRDYDALISTDKEIYWNASKQSGNGDTLRYKLERILDAEA